MALGRCEGLEEGLREGNGVGNEVGLNGIIEVDLVSKQHLLIDMHTILRENILTLLVGRREGSDVGPFEGELLGGEVGCEVQQSRQIKVSCKRRKEYR